MSDIGTEIQKSFSGEGFMYQARHMIFDEVAAVGFIATIENITAEQNPQTRNVLVRQLCDIPFLALLWEEKCVKNGADARKYRETVRILRQVVLQKIELLLPPNAEESEA